MKYLQNNLSKFALGNICLAPSYLLDGEEKTLVYQESGTDECILLFGKNEEISDELRLLKNETGYTVRRTVKNVSGKTLCLNAVKVAFYGIDFRKSKRDDYFYAPENVRIYCSYTFPIDYRRTEDDALNSEFDVVANNRWADPGTVSDKINASPYQPFPAILISNYQSTQGLVFGALSQRVFYQYYLLEHDGEGVKCELYSAFKGIKYRELQSGEYLIDEWYIGKTDKADKYDCLFDGYTQELRKKLPANYGASSLNRDNLVWGSWNDGIFRDISEDMLLKEAQALKEHFPNMRWLQVDDGYATLNEHPHGLGMPYEKGAGVDKEKFPQGLKRFTDKLREIGLRPAVWVGGYCPKNSKIYKDKKEDGWFIDYDKRIDDKAPFDVSQAMVRAYMEKALDAFVYEYGFDSIKHDFWSYAFEDSDDLLCDKSKSGYEHRLWWLQTIRKKLPGDGYFQTGCDIVLGNPFLGEYFTNYRYGIDVGGGNWTNLKTTMAWGTACFATHTGDLFVPNSDAIGLLPALTDADFLCWVNFVIITHSMVEISGRFSLGQVNEYRLKTLKKATCCVNNGQDVYTANFNYRASQMPAPEVYYTKTPMFSTEENEVLPLRTLAILNINEEYKDYTVSLAELGLTPKKRYLLTDVWTGERREVTEEITLGLGRHESKLLHISILDKVLVDDANTKISNLKRTDGGIEFLSQNGREVELGFRAKATCVTVDGRRVPFNQVEDRLSFVMEQDGVVQIYFY